MSFKITYCPICAAEHSDKEKMTEREAVQECLVIDDVTPWLTTEQRAEHIYNLDRVQK